MYQQRYEKHLVNLSIGIGLENVEELDEMNAK